MIRRTEEAVFAHHPVLDNGMHRLRCAMCLRHERREPTSGQLVLNAYVALDYRDRNQQPPTWHISAWGHVIHVDDEVALVRVQDSLPFKYFVFLAPTWEDDRAQLWRLNPKFTQRA